MSPHHLRYWGLKILTVWGIVLTAFVLPHLLPGSPLSLYESWPMNSQQQASLVTTYGFDRPLPIQYLIWMQRLATGQWGYSQFHHRPVFHSTLRATGCTAILLFWTGIAFGLWRCVFAGAQRMLRWLGISLPRGIGLTFLDVLPKFLLAIIIHDLAVWRLGWTSVVKVAAFDPYHYLNPLIMLLPAATLALPLLVVWHARERAIPISQALSRGQQWRQHGEHLGSLFHPFLGYFFMEVLLTEHVFALPGLGSFGIHALRRRDFPDIQGFILGTGGLYLLLLLLFDRRADDRPGSGSVRPTRTIQPHQSRHLVYSGTWGIMVLIALAAWSPRLWLHDPMEIHSHDQLLLPNARYILGTDFLGRDVLSRTVEGFRSSMSRVALSLGLIGIASGLFLGLKHLLPLSLRWVWDSTLALFEALPPFLLAILSLLITEARDWPLEVALSIACVPVACKMATFRGSLLHRLATLAYLAELVLLLEVSVFYLNLSPEAATPTWGGDLRVGMNYGHLNIWLLLAPTLAVTWSRYLLHKLGAYSLLVDASACSRVMQVQNANQAGR